MKQRKVLTEEHKRHISEAHKKAGVGKWMLGRKISPETIAKRVAKMKGRKRPPFSEEWKKKIGEASRGRVWTPEALENLKKAKEKYIHSPEYREKMRQVVLKRNYHHSDELKKRFSLQKTGELNPNWNNNATWRSGKIRQSAPYRAWHKAVLKRDNFACVECFSTENLDVDHIKPMSLYPELMFNLDNGRVLCRPCHIKTPTWGFNKNTHRYDTI